MTGRLVARQDLTAADIAAMQRLLATHFSGVTDAQFSADLAEKNWAVLIEQDDTLVGFSTLHVERMTVDAEALVVIYSGDTIVSPAAWGSAVFPKAWISSVYQLRATYPDGRLIWLLLSSGYRTYRFLPVFWQTFYPRFDAPTPPAWQRLLDTLAGRRFGGQFDRPAGVVRFARPHQLRGRLAVVPGPRQHDPHVAFFLQNNPGHANGDELVCVADLDPSNLTRAGRRVVYGAAR